MQARCGAPEFRSSKLRLLPHRLGLCVAANPRRVNEMTSNKMNASISAFRFRYRQWFPAAARSGYLVRSVPAQPNLPNIYVTVCLTFAWSTYCFQTGSIVAD
jgi:hypothetical protein